MIMVTANAYVGANAKMGVNDERLEKDSNIGRQDLFGLDPHAQGGREHYTFGGN